MCFYDRTTKKTQQTPPRYVAYSFERLEGEARIQQPANRPFFWVFNPGDSEDVNWR